MKKVKLKALDLGAPKLLSREKQSIVFGSGGSGSGGSGEDPCAGKSSTIEDYMLYRENVILRGKIPRKS